MTSRDKLDRPPLSDESALLLAYIKQNPKRNAEDIANLMNGYDDEAGRAEIASLAAWLVNNQYVERAVDGTLTARMT